MNDDTRIAAAFRATFLASAALLALVCALSLTHGASAPSTPPVAAEGFGWPI